MWSHDLRMHLFCARVRVLLELSEVNPALQCIASNDLCVVSRVSGPSALVGKGKWWSVCG